MSGQYGLRDESANSSVTTSPTHIQGNEYPSMIKLSRPFLRQVEIDHLRNLNGLKDPAFSNMRCQLFAHIWAIAASFKFPIKTIGTAMLLLQKTLLYNKAGSFPKYETAVACLLVASKVEDTPKRAKEILLCSQGIRNLNTNLSNEQLDEIRAQILAVERQILETLAFDFRIRHPHPYVVKICKVLKISMDVANMAWTIATDSYMTDAPLKYPSHTIALASIILSSKIQDISIDPPMDVTRFHTSRINVSNTLIDLLDFYIHSLNSSLLGREMREVSKFMSIRIEINKENPQQLKSAKMSSIGLSVREPKISDKGTVRYVLNWEQEHVTGEIIS